VYKVWLTLVYGAVGTELRGQVPLYIRVPSRESVFQYSKTELYGDRVIQGGALTLS
jgi:hypothetical protein